MTRHQFITTPVGGIKDVIINRQNGLLIQVGNFDELKKAMHTLITDNSLSNALSEASLRTVKDYYSREIITRKYIELFKGYFA